VLAVDQRQAGGKDMRVRGGGDHDGIEIVRVVEEAAAFQAVRVPRAALLT
jgi:hypothetical protein